MMLRFLFTSVLALGFVLAMATPVSAQVMDWTVGNTEDACVRQVTLREENGDTKLVEVATLQGIGCIARNILAVATTVIGLLAFVMLILGAFLWLSSGGQGKHIEAARQTITYAIAGLLVALMSFFIINLIANFTGAKGILRFDIFEEWEGYEQPDPCADGACGEVTIQISPGAICPTTGTHEGCDCTSTVGGVAIVSVPKGNLCLDENSATDVNGIRCPEGNHNSCNCLRSKAGVSKGARCPNRG